MTISHISDLLPGTIDLLTKSRTATVKSVLDCDRFYCYLMFDIINGNFLITVGKGSSKFLKLTNKNSNICLSIFSFGLKHNAYLFRTLYIANLRKKNITVFKGVFVVKEWQGDLMDFITFIIKNKLVPLNSIQRDEIHIINMKINSRWTQEINKRHPQVFSNICFQNFIYFNTE